MLNAGNAALLLLLRRACRRPGSWAHRNPDLCPPVPLQHSGSNLSRIVLPWFRLFLWHDERRHNPDPPMMGRRRHDASLSCGPESARRQTFETPHFGLASWGHSPSPVHIECVPCWGREGLVVFQNHTVGTRFFMPVSKSTFVIRWLLVLFSCLAVSNPWTFGARFQPVSSRYDIHRGRRHECSAVRHDLCARCVSVQSC